MFSRSITAIAVVAIILASAIACANSIPSTTPTIAQAPADRFDRDRERWLGNLNLSRDQLQKIQQIRDRYKDQLNQQRQAVQQAQTELRTLMVGNASTEAIRQKYQQVEGLRQQLATTRFNVILAIREVLTLEQRQKVAEHMQKVRGNFKKRLRRTDSPFFGVAE